MDKFDIFSFTKYITMLSPYMTDRKSLMDPYGKTLNHCMMYMYLQVVTTLKMHPGRVLGANTSKRTPDHKLQPSVMRTGM